MRSKFKACSCAAAALAGALALWGGAAQGQTAGSSAPSTDNQAETKQGGPVEAFAFHAQSTFIYQGHNRFDSPYRGSNSLSPRANARETWDVTLYGGVRPWRGAEIWINPEIDQGFGLSNTLGVAGFPSGEAYKVGAAEPYVRLQRLFFRQTIDLPGEREKVDSDLNQLAGSRSVNRIVFTGGKLSVGDIFDTNKYAHDPRGDFMNWTLIDAGTFDYAADAWGYSAGAALEWYENQWTVRGGAKVGH
jgi:high affinity Mn2+ porin